MLFGWCWVLETIENHVFNNPRSKTFKPCQTLRETFFQDSWKTMPNLEMSSVQPWLSLAPPWHRNFGSTESGTEASKPIQSIESIGSRLHEPLGLDVDDETQHRSMENVAGNSPKTAKKNTVQSRTKAIQKEKLIKTGQHP